MSVYSKRKDGERERGRELEFEEGYFVKPEVECSGVGRKRTERQGRSRERENKFIVRTSYIRIGLCWTIRMT